MCVLVPHSQTPCDTLAEVGDLTVSTGRARMTAEAGGLSVAQMYSTANRRFNVWVLDP